MPVLSSAADKIRPCCSNLPVSIQLILFPSLKKKQLIISFRKALPWSALESVNQEGWPSGETRLEILVFVYKISDPELFLCLLTAYTHQTKREGGHSNKACQRTQREPGAILSVPKHKASRWSQMPNKQTQNQQSPWRLGNERSWRTKRGERHGKMGGLGVLAGDWADISPVFISPVDFQVQAHPLCLLKQPQGGHPTLPKTCASTSSIPARPPRSVWDVACSSVLGWSSWHQARFYSQQGTKVQSQQLHCCPLLFQSSKDSCASAALSPFLVSWR